MVGMNRKTQAATTALLVLSSAWARSAVHYRVIKEFGGWDGNYPQAPLLQGSDGALHGKTSSGGRYGDKIANNGFATEGGVVFRMNLNGSALLVLHDFGTTTNDRRNRLGTLIARPPHLDKSSFPYSTVLPMKPLTKCYSDG